MRAYTTAVLALVEKVSISAGAEAKERHSRGVSKFSRGFLRTQFYPRTHHIPSHFEAFSFSSSVLIQVVRNLRITCLFAPLATNFAT